MIVSDKYGFVIACPTKTGTNTVRALVESFKRKGGRANVLTLLTGEKRTRHRIAPPSGKEGYRRYVLTRDDESRIVSMYEYLRRKDWEWAAGDILHNEAHYGREEAWIRFLRLIAATRQSDGYFDGGRRHVHGSRPYMWTDIMEEITDYMDGIDLDGSTLPWFREDAVTELALSTLEQDWRDLLLDNTVDEELIWDLSVTHRNASPLAGKLFDNTAAYWKVDGARSLLAEIRNAAVRL